MSRLQQGTEYKNPGPNEPPNDAGAQSTRSSRDGLPGWRGFLRKHFVRPFVRSTNPPWFDARGIAVGLVVGFGLPVGTQMLFLGLLRVLFRFNSLLAFAFTWVNNPLTLLPMYYGYYYLGSIILGKPVVMTPDAFRELIHPIVHAGHFWESLQASARLSADIISRWAISAVIVASVSGVLGYVIGYHRLRKRCLVRARRMGTSYEKLINDMEQSLMQRRRHGSA